MFPHLSNFQGRLPVVEVGRAVAGRAPVGAGHVQLLVTGALRWQPPEPVSPWEGVRDCTAPAPICPQIDSILGTMEGQEDCLYLNVETPVVGHQFLYL